MKKDGNIQRILILNFIKKRKCLILLGEEYGIDHANKFIIEFHLEFNIIHFFLKIFLLFKIILIY